MSSISDQGVSKFSINQSTTPDNHLQKNDKTKGPLNLFSPGLSPIHSNTNVQSISKSTLLINDMYRPEPNNKISIQKGFAIHQFKEVSDLDTPISNFWRTRLFGTESLDESFVTADTDLHVTTQSLVYPASSKLYQISSQHNKSFETLDSEYDVTKISLVFPITSLQNENVNDNTDLNSSIQSLIYSAPSSLYQISSEQHNKSFETLDSEIHIAKESLLYPEIDTSTSNSNIILDTHYNEMKRLRDASFDTIDSEFDVTKMSLVYPNATMLGSEYNISSHYLSEDSDDEDDDSDMFFFGDIQDMTFGSGTAHSLHSMSLLLPRTITSTTAAAAETKSANNIPIPMKTKRNGISSKVGTENIVYSDSDIISRSADRKISYQSLHSANDHKVDISPLPTTSKTPSIDHPYKHDVSVSPISIGSLYTLLRDNNGQPIFVPIISYNDPLLRTDSVSIKGHRSATEGSSDSPTVVVSSSSHNYNMNSSINQTPIRHNIDYHPSSPHTNLNLLNQFYAYQNNTTTSGVSSKHNSNHIQTNPLNRILFKALSSHVGDGLTIASTTTSTKMSVNHNNDSNSRLYTTTTTPKRNKHLTTTSVIDHRISLPGPNGKECLLPSSEYWKHRMIRRNITSSITSSTTKNNTYIGAGIATYNSFSLL